MRGTSRLAQELVASYERLRSVELDCSIKSLRAESSVFKSFIEVIEKSPL